MLAPAPPRSPGRTTRRLLTGSTAPDGVLVAAVALVVYALHGFTGLLNRDLGVFTYGGERLADAGVLPYTGIFNTVGPLADAVPGAAIRLGRLVGVGAISAERHVFWVVSALCCVLVAALGRQVARGLRYPRAAGLLAAALFLTFGDFTRLATDGPREKTVMVLFLLGALLLLDRRRWAAAGACTALATLTWQPVFLVAITAAAVTLALTPASAGVRLRAAAAHALGGAVPTALVVLVYAVRGEVSWALQGFLLVNARYVHQTSLVDEPIRTTHVLWVGYGWSLPLVVAGLVGLVLAAAVAAVRGRRDALVVAGIAAVVGIAWSTAVINGSPDLFLLLPFAAVGAALPVAALAERAAGALRHPSAASPAVAVVAVAAVAVAGVASASTREHSLLLQRHDVQAVLAAAPGASLLSIDVPEAMAIAHRVNPTPYQIFDVGIDGYLEHTWPGGLAGLAEWIDRVHPTLIVREAADKQTWPDAMLARDYVVAGAGPAWRWYVARSAGPQLLDAVRAVARGTAPAAPADTVPASGGPADGAATVGSAGALGHRAIPRGTHRPRAGRPPAGRHRAGRPRAGGARDAGGVRRPRLRGAARPRPRGLHLRRPAGR